MIGLGDRHTRKQRQVGGRGGLKGEGEEGAQVKRHSIYGS